MATGLLEAEARELNLGLREAHDARVVPRVTVKIAMSLDGRIALANGVSQWITGEAARADVQQLRAAASAVLTGIDTVLADDPQLNVRDPSIELLGRQPLRVVLDTQLRMPPAARMLHEPGDTLIFTAQRRALAARGACSARAPKSSVRRWMPTGTSICRACCAELGRRECNDVLVEAGPTLVGAISAARAGRRADRLRRADAARARRAGHGAAAAAVSHSRTSLRLYAAATCSAIGD